MTKKNLINEVAKEQIRGASDRTLMAWVRTSISLIGFGFAIAATYEYAEISYLEKTGKVLDAIPVPTVFGASFMLLGMLGIFAGVIQYRRILKRINSDQFVYVEPLPLPQILAMGLLIIGALGFIMLLF